VPRRVSALSHNLSGKSNPFGSATSGVSLSRQIMPFLPIHEAATSGDVDALRRALEDGGSPNAADTPYGFTPLHYLCGGVEGGDRVACVKLLIASGANVNVGNSADVTPLHFAILNHPEFVPLLLASGADPNCTTSGRQSALHYVFMGEMDHNSRVVKAMVQELIRAGGDVNLTNQHGRTPLEAAIFISNVGKLYPIFFRAGAALPAGNSVAYVRKIRAAGGFKRYEQNHLNAITATFVPKFPRLPPEMVRRVVEYAFHVGDY